MTESLYWLLAVELIGIATFPITFVLFPFLSDRGYAFTKALGLVLVGYALWMGGLTGVWSNSRGSIILILLLLALTSALIAGRRRFPIADFLRQYWDYILLVEALFLFSFLLAIFLRSYVPEVEHTEKPMDFAFLNAIVRADRFPPEDPWLAGYPISYYYFGHLMVATLTVLTGISTAITFNLGVALVTALMAVSAFGLVFNIVRLAGGSANRALVFGLVGIVLLMIVSNLVGFFELLAVHGVGSRGFYQTLDIDGLDGPRSSTSWYPTEWWWWWRTTRVASMWDWREPPFFTLLLGDLHAHLLAVPFVLMGIAVALSFLRWDGVLDGRFWLRHPWRLGVTALLIGSLAFLNAWDMPTILMLVIAAAFLRNCLSEGRLTAKSIGQIASFAVPLAVLAVLLFVPFYRDFHPVGEGIHPLEAARAARNGWPPLDSVATRPHHLMYLWAPLLWVAASFGVTAVLRGKDNRLRTFSLSLLPGLLPLGLWTAMILFRRSAGGLADEMDARGWNWLTLVILIAVLTVLTWGFLRHLPAARQDHGQRSLIFALGLAIVGVLLILGQELYWVQDPVGVRSNTTFRLSYQASIVLAVSGAFGLHYITWRWHRIARPIVVGRYGWAMATGVILAVAMIFPVTATFARTNGFDGQRSLDGLRGIRVSAPAEYNAIQWLNQNVGGTPIILEAVGNAYSDLARISARTGLPTLLGWPEHEYRWRGSWKYQGTRKDDVATVYKTASADMARAILEREGVRYVYVGPKERREYGEEGLAKFAEFMEPVFQDGDVVIYQMPSPGRVPTVNYRSNEGYTAATWEAR